MDTWRRPVRYEIRVFGVLEAGWSAWFAGLEVRNDATAETTLTGALPDQAALHGVLARVRDLGLPLIGVRRLDPEPGDAQAAAEPSATAELPAAHTQAPTAPLGRSFLVTQTQNQILDLSQRWAEAERTADVAALDALLADDFAAIGPFGFVLDRGQWLDRLRPGSDLKIRSFSWGDVSVRAYEDTAIAVGVQTQGASYREQDSSGRFRVTHVYMRRMNRWLITHIQLSGPMPDIPPRQG